MFSTSQSRSLIALVIAAVLASLPLPATSAPTSVVKPGSRSLMDAHNCYPYAEWWSDRIDRALSAGTPLAIEQDLLWYTDPRTGQSRSVLSHGAPAYGNEPTMETYFFQRIRPIMEQALKDGNKADWPLITLNLDFKTEEPEHLAAVWNLLTTYRDWITTAPRVADESTMQPLDVKPLLVLTGESDAQQKIFEDRVPVGDRLLVFGAVHTNMQDPMGTPNVIESGPPTNYRRWWNNPWSVVERGGQNNAGAWTSEDNQRLQSLVRYAHSRNLWIRFYTLDGSTVPELSSNGWFRQYNFGSLAAAKIRWRAAAEDGVDYIASDRYELLGAYLRQFRAVQHR
ncbi:MAG: hypothetical protein ACRD40_19885 [Candidatus Acidiferrales bacterium]